MTLAPIVVTPNYGSATGHVEPHVLLLPVPGEISLGLEDQITCPLPDAITGRSEVRARPAHLVLTRFAEFMAPGLFDPEEPDPVPFAPGYTLERHSGVDVIWPTRAQESIDPTIRFRGRNPAAAAFLAKLGAWCLQAAVGNAPMIGP